MPSSQDHESHSYIRDLVGRRNDVAVHPADALDHPEPGPGHRHHFYRPGELLVSAEPGQVESFERTARRLRIQCFPADNYNRPILRGKERELPSPLPSALRYVVQSESSLEDVLNALQQASGGNLKVTPNHVVFGSPVWGLDPYGDPSPPSPGDPRPAPNGDGRGVVVAILDGGLPRGYKRNTLLAKNVETWRPEEEPWTYSGAGHVLERPQGHGAFVAGMVRQAAANATVRSYRVLDTDGVTDEWYLGHQLALVLAGGADVVNLSLGTSSRGDQALMGLSALETAVRQAKKGAGPPAPIVVAAAGNLGDSREFYPAADDWTIGVGAVSGPGGEPGGRPISGSVSGPGPARASFSNFGPWVDVCARGDKVLSSFEDHPYRSSSAPSGPLQFDGFAVWSGTSFAAAYVSGKVAEVLARRPGLDRAGVIQELGQLAGSCAVDGLGSYVP